MTGSQDLSDHDLPDIESRSEKLAASAVVMLSFILLLGLFFLRRFDDNRLVSWRWLFDNCAASDVFVVLFIGMGVAYMLTTIRLPGPVGLFVLSLVTSSVFLGTPEVIIDASRYFTQAKFLGQYGPGYFVSHWGRGIEAWTDLPLMPMIYGLGFRYFGEHRLVVQVIVMLMFAATVVLTYLLGRDVFGQRTGRIGAMFMLSIPYLYTQIPLMMVDVPSMFFLLCAVYCFRRGLLSGGVWAWLLGPGALALAFLSKYSQWAMLTVTLPVFALAVYESRRPAILRAIAISAVFCAIVLPVLWYFRDVMASQIELLFTYQRPGLRRWSESSFSTFFFHVHPFVTLAALASVVMALRRKDWGLLAIAWLPVLMVLVLQAGRIRYLVPVFPMLALMGAYGVTAIRSTRAARATAWVAFVASFILATTAYAPFLQINSLVNLKLAGQYVNSTGQDTIILKTLPQKSSINPAVAVPLLDLYTDARIIYDYVAAPPLSEDEIAVSPFRFTWTYSNPQYYENAGSAMYSGEYCLVVTGHDMAGMDNQGLQCKELVEKYTVHEGLFRFKPLVFIYR